ncbi:MAG TPA: prolyl oligopeptidase family serine peptidase [Thermoanaerobaculia bacterium]|nr:prolyl oligopeptidase family serine peptidase [Thermoanaerobaculia bacterium]
MRRTGLALLALLALAGPVRAELTLDALLTAPFPVSLTPAPGGGGVAWVEVEKGARSLWVALAPAYSPRRVVRYGEDDGIDLHGLAFSPDKSHLAFVRGGAEGSPGGEGTNPASLPDGFREGVWVVAADGETAPRRVDDGSGPVFAPKGDRLAYLKGGQLWHAALDPKVEPAQLAQVSGRVRAPRFSPDGTRLAFENPRGTHGLVGVLDLEARRIVWLDPGVDRDSEPVWSPDGRHVAVLRIATSNEPDAFLPNREDPPWSIRVADPASGRGREIFRAEPGPGSAFRGFAGSPQLLWGDGDRLVFAWERTGWSHLWAVPVAGGPAVDLTPGAFEVEHASLSADRRRVLYSANARDLDRRELWEVAVAGGAPKRLAPREDGQLQARPLDLGGGAGVVYAGSDARRPLQLWRVGEGGGALPLRPEAIPASFPLAELVEPQLVRLRATDGKEVPAQLFLPRAAPGRRPAVIFVHGGPQRQMLPGWHPLGYYHRAYALNQLLVSRGFVVLSINFRSGIGYGLDFREAEGIGEAGASEFRDVLGAALWLGARPDVDSSRLGIWGGSYGGYLTALALARASDLFRCGVDFHGVHDWNLEWPAPEFNREYLATAARLEKAWLASPMADLGSWRSPVLLITGDADRNVPFIETVRLVEELRKRNVSHEVVVYPDEVHSFLRHANWVDAYTRTVEYLERHLGMGE